MKSTASPLVDERAQRTDLSIDRLLKPIADELEQTQALYERTILQSAERNYIHMLLSGEAGGHVPDEFHVDVADQIGEHLRRSPGKWIRAAIVLLSAKACGKSGEAVHQIAVAVELVHLATLVHDDIIDEAPMRRGVQSIPGGWGNAIAVLMGDFLLSKAFKLLLVSQSVYAQTLLTRATGQMCLGEIKQLRFNQVNRMNERDYLEMIENKTASLMAAAAATGAHAGGLSEVNVEHMHAYGHAVGMAFQIADDVLDYTASTTILGKERGVDLRNGKTTLPLLHLLHHDGQMVQSILEGNLPIEQKTRQMVELMRDMGSIEYAYGVGRQYGQLAKENLNAAYTELVGNDAFQSLNQLVDFVLTRER